MRFGRCWKVHALGFTLQNVCARVGCKAVWSPYFRQGQFCGVARTPMKVGKTFRIIFRDTFERCISHISFVRTNLLLPARFFYTFTCWIAFQNYPVTTSQGIKQIMSQFSWRARQHSVAMVVVVAVVAPVVKSPTALLNVDERLFILPPDCQMAPSFVSAQETSCSLGRHCRAELNFEMVVISCHKPKGYPNTYFTPTSAQEVVRLRIYTYIYI